MEDLVYYNTMVDRALQKIIQKQGPLLQNYHKVIQKVTRYVHQQDGFVSRKKTKLLVTYLVARKLEPYYIYNKCSLYNRPELLADDTSVRDGLVDHQYDVPNLESFQEVHLKRYQQFQKLLQKTCYAQRSPEWYRQRNSCLTATSIATVLDEDPYKYPIELLLEKCGQGKPYEDNLTVHHGKKYEKIGSMYYAYRNNIRVHEFGVLQSEVYPFIGASPDGICGPQTLDGQYSRLVGRLIEIKFPKYRRIRLQGKLDGEICPHYYMVQIQTQLFVTGLDECDFLQFSVEEYDSFQEYLQDEHPGIAGLSRTTMLEKGCLVRLFPRKMLNLQNEETCVLNSIYIYPPKLHMDPAQVQKWIAQETMRLQEDSDFQNYFLDRVIYWRLKVASRHLIRADTQWFCRQIPKLKQFWDYVLFYRKHPDLLGRLLQYLQKVDRQDSKKIFEWIHQEYQKLHPGTNYRPLYSEPSAWRTMYKSREKVSTHN